MNGHDRQKIFIGLVLGIWFLGGIHISLAKEPLKPEDVPAPLKPWVSWVLDSHDDWACPMLYNDAKERVCAWPSRLALIVTSDGGSFTQKWEVIRETTVRLPGERAFWPQDISVDGRSVVVGDKRGRPTIALPKGQHIVKGSWRWTRVPESLLLPKETALLEVTMNGKVVSVPQVDSKGRLWFRPQVAASVVAEASDTLEVRVFRKLIDEIPFQVVTQWQLVVGGQPREVLLPGVLDVGMRPLAIESPLPAQIDTNGQGGFKLVRVSGRCR